MAGKNGEFLRATSEIVPPDKSASDVLKLFTSNFDFRRELNNLRRQNLYTDVTIICGIKELKAHKFVLAAGSAYFYKVLSRNSKSPDFIEIFNADLNILEEILFFIYTGELSRQQFSQPEINNLVKTAHKLEVYNMLPAILKYLLSNLTDKNFSLALQLAGDLNDSTAENTIFKYVISVIEIVWKTTEFANMSENHISVVISKMVRGKLSDDIILQALLVWANYKSEERSTVLSRLLTYVNLDKISPRFSRSVLQEKKSNFSREAKIIRAELNSRNQWKHNFGQSMSVPNVSRKCDLKPRISACSRLKCYENSSTPDNPSLVVIGKDSANRVLVVKYELNTNTWEDIVDTGASVEERPGIGYYDYKVYFVGGENFRGVKLNNVSYYDMKTKKTYSLPPIKVVRSQPAVFVLNDFLFVIGGSGRFGHDGISVVEKLDLLQCATWSIGPAMRKRRKEGTRLMEYQNKLLATGGGPSECEFYNWERRYWTKSKPLPIEVQPETAFHVIADKKLFAFREFRPDCVYMLNFESNEWIRVGLSGKPPEWVVSAVGWNSAIFVLTRSKLMFALNVITYHWSVFSKLPSKLIPLFVQVEVGTDKN